MTHQHDTQPMPDVYADLPMDILRPLDDYLEHGLDPGHALTAFLTNDLFGVLKRGDTAFLAHLRLLGLYCMNYLPAGVYGSRKAVTWWVEQRREQRAEYLMHTRHRTYYRQRLQRASLDQLAPKHEA
jgi:hypothetical protein